MLAGVAGGDVALYKVIDIDPGYTYDVESNIYFANSSHGITYKVTVGHKTASGKFIPINEYIQEYATTQLNADDVTKSTSKLCSALTTTTTSVSSLGSVQKATLSSTVKANDALANAIKVSYAAKGMSGEVWVSTDGFTVYKTGSYNVQNNPVTHRPVEVSYDLGANGGKLTDTLKLAAGATGKASLRPVTVSGTKVVSAQGYFKGWKLGETSTIYTSEEGKKAPVGASDSALALNALWYAVENNVVSGAQAQRAVVNDNGTEKNVIRFLALVDDSFADYKEVGFVFTTLAQNPTIEAGYNKHAYNEIYKKINVAGNALDIADPTFLASFTNKGATLNPTGIVYANVVIASGDENIVYYATPYIEKADGTRVYGTTKQASYSALADLDDVQ